MPILSTDLGLPLVVTFGFHNHASTSGVHTGLLVRSMSVFLRQEGTFRGDSIHYRAEVARGVTSGIHLGCHDDHCARYADEVSGITPLAAEWKRPH
jgi:hypothetical protein